MLFEERGVGIVAASADPLDKAKAMAGGMALRFPVGYGIDAKQVSDLTGAVIDEKNRIVQPCAFILRPDRTVAVSVYSSWAVGRLRPDEVFGAIHYLGAKG